MKLTLVIAIAVVAAGVGVAVGTGFTGDSGGPAPTSAEAENARLAEEVELLREKLASGTAADRARKDPADPAATDSAGAPTPAAPSEAAGDVETAASAEETPAGAPHFGDVYGGALDRLDWKKIGSNLSRMNPYIVEIVESIHAHEPAPPTAVGKVQELNGPLLAAALSLQETEVPGTGVIGKFTDPAFMVNAMVSALEAAGKPLDATQERRLVESARHHMDLDRRRREGYDDRVWQIQRLYEEADLKDSFFREALGLLDAEQLEIVAPEETRNRLRLALFSSSVLYAPRTRFERYGNREHLAEVFTHTVSEVISATGDRRKAVLEIVSEWLTAVPGDLIEWEPNALDLNGMVLAGRVTAWAKQEHELLKLVVARMELGEGQRKGVSNVASVLVPLFQTSVGD